MPFTSIPWWMRLYQPQAGTGLQDESLPPPAVPGNTPTTAPNLAPGLGGPGSYPEASPTPRYIAPTPPPAPTPTPTPTPVPFAGPTFPSDPYGYRDIGFGPNFPGLSPAGPSTTAGGQPATAPGGGPTVDVITARNAPTTVPSTGGWGTRSDDAGVVPGVNLSPTDRANIALHNLGLPPLPTGYSPFGGLPPGFTEGNRFGGGAPTFTYTNPLLNTGPQWTGGSIFGQLPGVRGGPLTGSFAGLGSGGGGTLSGGGIENALATAIAQRMRAGLPTTIGNAPGPGYQWGAGVHPVAPGWNYGRNILLRRGITSIGGGSPVGFKGSGVPPVHTFQEGGVAGDDQPDFYSRIGAATYNAGRKAENIFHALGELGKYLKPSQSDQVRPSAPIITLPEQPALGRNKIMRDLNQKRYQIYQELFDRFPLRPPAWVPPPSPSASYMMAYRGAVVPPPPQRDSVPAMLTPGEVVLNEQQQRAVMPIPGREHMLRADQRAKLASKMWR